MNLIKVEVNNAKALTNLGFDLDNIVLQYFLTALLSTELKLMIIKTKTNIHTVSCAPNLFLFSVFLLVFQDDL